MISHGGCLRAEVKGWGAMRSFSVLAMAVFFGFGVSAGAQEVEPAPQEGEVLVKKQGDGTTRTSYWDGDKVDNVSDFSLRILSTRNAERAKFGLKPLVWNDKLAADALAYAKVLAASGEFAHSSAGVRGNQGENLWVGTEGAFAIEEMTDHLLEERRNYRPGIFPAVSSTGRWEEVGHYTQIVWPKTREVGCALAQGQGQDWLVCRYFPAGNVVGTALGPGTEAGELAGR